MSGSTKSRGEAVGAGSQPADIRSVLEKRWQSCFSRARLRASLTAPQVFSEMQVNENSRSKSESVIECHERLIGFYFFELPSGSGKHQLLACKCAPEMDFEQNVHQHSVYVVS